MDGGSLRRSHLAFVGCAPLVAIHDCFILAARLRRERIVVLISILVRGAEPLVSPSHPVLRVWKSTYRSIPGSTGFIDCFPSRIIPHCCGPGGQPGHFDCFLEFGLAKRFADYFNDSERLVRGYAVIGFVKTAPASRWAIEQLEPVAKDNDDMPRLHAEEAIKRWEEKEREAVRVQEQ